MPTPPPPPAATRPDEEPTALRARPEVARGLAATGSPSPQLYPLPAGPVPRALLATCRPGPPLTPVDERDGWALYRLPDAEGQPVAVRTPDHPRFTDEDAEVLRCIEWLREPTTKALAALQALLSLALDRDGRAGEWVWGDVARAAWGRWAKSEHIELVRRAAALLARAHWPRFDDGPATTDASPWGGSPVLRVEQLGDCGAGDPQRCRCRSTATLSPRFARALREICPKVPAHHLQLPQAGRANPHGHRLSRVAQLRVRLNGLYHWLTTGPDAGAGAKATEKACTVSLHDVLSKWCHLDDQAITALKARRHMGEVRDDVVQALTAVRAAVGVGLVRAPAAAARLLDTALCLVGPRPRARNTPAPRPPASIASAAVDLEARPQGSRAPPPRRP